MTSEPTKTTAYEQASAGADGEAFSPAMFSKVGKVE